MDISRGSSEIRLHSPHPVAAESGISQRVTYRLARSRSDYEGAFRILQKRYAESGLTRNPSMPMRVMPFHLWPQTQVFVALDQDRVIGSVSLVRDEGDHGLPMESTYKEVVERLRSQGLMLAEVCCLCVGSDDKHSTGELFAGLTRIMAFHARYVGIKSLVAVVHPRHSKFYRLAMGFSEIGGLSAYRQVGGRPGVPIQGQFHDDSSFRGRWKRYYFAGAFAEEELRPRPMSMIDREYFRRFVENYDQTAERRSAA